MLASLVAAPASAAPPPAPKKNAVNPPPADASSSPPASSSTPPSDWPPAPASAEPPPPPAVPPPPKSEPAAPLPDPRTYRQSPPPVPEPPPDSRYWTLEAGIDVGVISRSVNGAGVHDSPGFAFGAHVRGKILKWLDARVAGRTESCPYSYDDGALGLPSGTHIDQPGPRRVYLNAALEPNWSPIPRLDLWAGVGIGWGRTIAPPMQTTGTEVVALPTRAAVFVEVPLSLGVRYEIIPYWLVVNLSASVAFPGNQSGTMISPYRTPGKDGKYVTVGGFPELGTSWLGLAGLGILL